MSTCISVPTSWRLRQGRGSERTQNEANAVKCFEALALKQFCFESVELSMTEPSVPVRKEAAELTRLRAIRLA